MRDSRPRAFPPLSFTLRGFYFLAFFGLGVYGPYLSIFLRSRGLSGAEVGTVWALMPLGAVLAPPLWGMVADKFRNRKVLIFCLSAAGGGGLGGPGGPARPPPRGGGGGGGGGGVPL
ncbi:MAG: MFS transporter, partial [Nitrospinota bacterium]|nr:MFS transporter [Nitrospinota bacterium]